MTQTRIKCSLSINRHVVKAAWKNTNTADKTAVIVSSCAFIGYRYNLINLITFVCDKYMYKNDRFLYVQSGCC